MATRDGAKGKRALMIESVQTPIGSLPRDREAREADKVMTSARCPAINSALLGPKGQVKNVDQGERSNGSAEGTGQKDPRFA